MFSIKDFLCFKFMFILEILKTKLNRKGEHVFTLMRVTLLANTLKGIETKKELNCIPLFKIFLDHHLV